MNRICRAVQAELPAVVGGTAPRWRCRLVALHVRRCDDCRAERERQEVVAAGLDALGAAAGAAAATPPDGLLETLLEQAERPGVRGRAAVPARGAVSGARPALSGALLLAGAAVGTAAGYATWRAAGTVRGWLRRHASPTG